MLGCMSRQGCVAMCDCSPAPSRGVTTMLGCAGCGDQSGGGARDMGCRCLLKVPQLSSVGLDVGSDSFVLVGRCCCVCSSEARS